MDSGPILKFLKQLKKNNHKTWFDKHRGDYDFARREFEEFIADLIFRIAEFEPEMAAVRPKDCIFRIFRDVRFSKDKSPYKTNFGAFLAAGGRKTVKPGYYIHVEPGSSMLGGGVYMPMPDVLSKLRNLVADDGEELERILKSPSFKKYFKKLELMEGQFLKTMPKGFQPDHKYADWLKLKSFVVMYPLKDSSVTGSKFSATVAGAFKAMKPFNDYLGSVL